MPLPVTITGGLLSLQNSYQGPYKSSGGNFYFIGGLAADVSVVSAYKATDPTDSFTEQDTSNRPDSIFRNNSQSTFRKGDILYVGLQNNEEDVFHAQFDMANDIWVDIQAGARAVVVHDNSPEAQAIAATIAVEETGSDIIIGYQGNPSENKDMGGSFEWTAYAKSTDGGENWSSGNAVADVNDASEVDFTGPVIVRGSSDRMHFFFKDDTNNDAFQRTLLSDDTLETFPSAFDAAARVGTPYIFGRGIEGSAVSIPFQETGFAIEDATLTSGDAPSVTAGVVITDLDTNDSSFSMAADGTDIHLLYADLNDNDVQHTKDTGSGFDTDVEVLAGTVTLLSCNIYDRSGTKLAYIYDDGGTVKYNEVDIGVGPPTPPLLLHRPTPYTVRV